MRNSKIQPKSAVSSGNGAFSRNSITRILFAPMLVLFILVADQLTKNWAETELIHNQRVPVIGELFQLRLIYNPGAAFGMGANGTPFLTTFQILISLVVIFALIKLVRNKYWVLALSFLLGGAIGNIYDRIFKAPGFFHGHVVDFLELPNWPVFNVADIAVVTGACLMVLLTLLGIDHADRPNYKTKSAKTETKADPAEA